MLSKRLALALVAVGVVVALLAAEQHAWEEAGALLFSVTVFVLFRLAASRRWLEPKFDLNRFQQGIPAEEQLHRPLDPRKLGPIMIVIVLGWEAIVLVVGDLVLGLSTWAVLIGIFAVIPLSLAVALILVRRLPPELR